MRISRRTASPSTVTGTSRASWAAARSALSIATRRPAHARRRRRMAPNITREGPLAGLGRVEDHRAELTHVERLAQARVKAASPPAPRAERHERDGRYGLAVRGGGHTDATHQR